MTDNNRDVYIGPAPGEWNEINSTADEIFTMAEYDTIDEARSAERPWLDESFLRELYVEARMSSIEIAQFCGNITDAGVRYWLDKHGIERRSRSEAATEKWAKLRDPEHLRRLADEIEAALEDSRPTPTCDDCDRGVLLMENGLCPFCNLLDDD